MSSVEELDGIADLHVMRLIGVEQMASGVGIRSKGGEVRRIVARATQTFPSFRTAKPID